MRGLGKTFAKNYFLWFCNPLKCLTLQMIDGMFFRKCRFCQIRYFNCENKLQPKILNMCSLTY